MSFEIYDENFAKILGINPQLHMLATGFAATEGPVYFSDPAGDEGYFLFTENRKDAIHVIRWHGLQPFQQLTKNSYSEPAVFRHPTGISNGMTLDLKCRLITTEVGGHRIAITNQNGEVATIVDAFDGKKFNSPNDIIVKSDGTIWFTDPSYGALQFSQFCELPNYVYRFDPKTKALEAVIKDLDMPNGLAFSKDESLLYVADSGAIQARGTYYPDKPRDVYAYDVVNHGQKIENKRLFAKISPGFPDGLRVDIQDHVYVAAGDGVQVFNKNGNLIGKILLPKRANNLCFGSEGNNVLFVCASDTIWAIKLNTQGAKSIVRRGMHA